MSDSDDTDTIVISVESYTNVLEYLFDYTKRITELAMKEHHLRNAKTRSDIPKQE